MRRKQIPADCPVHGHPADLTPHNAALLQLYQVVNEPHGINSTVLYYCCQDYHVDFLSTYWQLKQVRQIVQAEREKVKTEKIGGTDGG